MLYRRFGKTELQIPVFTCGGMRFQHSWKDLNRVPKASQERLEATVRRAIDLGINHIETARGYGSSEYQLGRILSDYPREELIVQTKVAPAATADEFERMLERSLSLLKLDYVDLMSLHGVNSWQVLDWSLGKGGCLEVVRRYMDQGVIRHVGFSTHGPLELILRAIESEEFRVRQPSLVLHQPAQLAGDRARARFGHGRLYPFPRRTRVAGSMPRRRPWKRRSIRFRRCSSTTCFVSPGRRSIP